MIEILQRLGLPAASQAVPVLVNTIEKKDEDAGVKIAAIAALQSFGPDASSLAVPALIGAFGPDASSLAVPVLIGEPNECVEVGLATCVTLGWLGDEAKSAIPHLGTWMQSHETPRVDQAAVEALMKIDPEGEAIADKLVDEPIQRRVLSELRWICEPARGLRRMLERRWAMRWNADLPVATISGNPEDRTREGDESENWQPGNSDHQSDAKSASRKPRFQKWAFGMEAKRKWHIFEKLDNEWRHRGTLKGLAKGRQEELLEAFAKGGGSLSRAEALKLSRKNEIGKDSNLLNTIKSELTRIRILIKKTVGISVKGKGKWLDPLPWEKSSAGWRAEVSIGYAVIEDTEYADSSNRLRFKRSEELDRDERLM